MELNGVGFQKPQAVILEVLTDGLAGSAASTFVTGLIASGFATAFTYGGNGGPMDSTAFAGGNVEEYDGWWPKVAMAAEYGMCVPECSASSLSAELRS